MEWELDVPKLKFPLGIRALNLASTGAKLMLRVRPQCKSILGYYTRPNPASTNAHPLPAISFPRHDPVHLQLDDLLGPTWRPYFQWREFVMGVVWVAMLLIMKDIGKRYSKCAMLGRLAWVVGWCAEVQAFLDRSPAATEQGHAACAALPRMPPGSDRRA